MTNDTSRKMQCQRNNGCGLLKRKTFKAVVNDSVRHPPTTLLRCFYCAFFGEMTASGKILSVKRISNYEAAAVLDFAKKLLQARMAPVYTDAHCVLLLRGVTVAQLTLDQFVQVQILAKQPIV